ncbi:MAG TPA: ATP-dependent Clp protease adaptor ClpS [Ktedonobacterales bacterium]|nr:ATP-dependent Clp protease adaptor ClpS [Ktedonobacterales bacterium]
MPTWFKGRGEKHARQDRGARQALVVQRTPRAAIPRTDEEVRQILRLLPRYRVVLHNDEVNSMDEVVLALVRVVPSLGPQGAMRVMLEAHTHGSAEVIICPKEQAEYYRERLEAFGLTSTIEPA